jgi:hypothetical protein
MDIKEVMEKFADVELEFQEYSNFKATFSKMLLNGDTLSKVIYGDFVATMTFKKDSKRKFLEPEPETFAIEYKSAKGGGVMVHNL